MTLSNEFKEKNKKVRTYIKDRYFLSSVIHDYKSKLHTTVKNGYKIV